MRVVVMLIGKIYLNIGGYWLRLAMLVHWFNEAGYDYGKGRRLIVSCIKYFTTGIVLP